jgi:hypothetical protein
MYQTLFYLNTKRAGHAFEKKNGRVLAGEAKVGLGGGSKGELGPLATGNVNMKPLLVFLSKALAASVDVKSDFRGCF